MTVLVALVAAASLVACGRSEGNAAAQTAAPPASAAASVHEAPSAPLAQPVRSGDQQRSTRPVAATHAGAARTSAAREAPGPTETAPPRSAAADAQYGTVIRIDPIERAEQPSGAGAVVGGLLGAVVGHQFGGGNGRTLATAAGAVGGAFAGNAIEKQRSRTVVGWRVDVRLDNGSTRSFKLGSPGTLAVGSRVHVEGSTISAA